MRKTPAVAYYTRRMRTDSRAKLWDDIEDAPLTTREKEFLEQIMEGLTYAELAERFNKSESRIGKWKREVYEKLHNYDLHKARNT